MRNCPAKEIALAVNVGITHLERVVRGIRHYSKANTNWRFLVNPETHGFSPAALEGWRGDGVIALANQPEDFHVLETLDCPVVNISGAVEKSPFPRVRPDYRKIGAIAARHLIEKGYQRFGFYGMAGVWYSSQYQSGFTDELAKRNVSCSLLEASSTFDGATRWDTGQNELENWLSGLKPPFAVMSAHDPRAALVIQACDRVGLRVPDDVAIIGVNNDTVACESCQPELTSIERNDSDIGFRAAEMLDQLIHDAPVPDTDLIIPPGKICERGSTDSLGIDPGELRNAIEFAKNRFHDPISVSDLVEESHRSRRWLEEAFATHLETTPGKFLFQLRIDEARRLSRDHPELGPGDVARRCGYSGTRQLNAHFQASFGKSFKEYSNR